MRIINNKMIRTVIISIMTLLLLPIINYLIKALFSLGRLSGTFIRFLSTI